MTVSAPGAAAPLPASLMAQPCLALDLSRDNAALQGFDPANPAAFGEWLARQIEAAGCSWAAGGYGEDRAVYEMSPLFGSGDGARRSVHLGLDLWMPAATPVHAVLDGEIHSLADNARFGDYGPTLIIEHRWQNQPLYSLYGHLSRSSLAAWQPGCAVARGEAIAQLGQPTENLGWPPHLHLQLIRDIGEYRGDYPGVCHRDQADSWLTNCPDPAGLVGAYYQPVRG